MEFGVKKGKTPKGGSKCFTLIFLWMNFSHFVPPVSGFSMRVCRISQGLFDCIDLNLTAVPHDVPSMVKSFDLSANKIAQIKVSDFKNLPLLTQLDLNSNHISQIDPRSFAGLISLRRLNLNNNRLEEIQDALFEGLSNLTDLWIHGNKIAQLASTGFKPLTSLNFLDISDNKLKRLIKFRSIVQQLPNLKVLSMKNNYLKSFQSRDVANSSLALTSLDLSLNHFAFFRITADIFPNLTSFNIGRNIGKQPIKWDVRNKTFLSRVSALDISELNLVFDDMRTFLESVNSSLTFLKMNEMKHSLDKLINISCTIQTMSKLKLRKNKLFYVRSTLFQLCVNVTEIDLSENRIEIVQDDSFGSVQGLRILALSKNRLQFVPPAVRNLPVLSELDLSSNNISLVGCDDFSNLTKLRQLNLNQNSISGLGGCVFKDLIQLQFLMLQNNIISKLNAVFTKYLPNLLQLHLNGNKLTAIKSGEFRGLKSLQNLSLHLNQITTLENGSFSGLTNLTAIQLQSNQIHTEEIHKGALGDLINLKSLHLGNNHIRYEESWPLRDPPFSKLSHLETLMMATQRYKGKAHLPSNILQGLSNLLAFSTRNIQLLSLPGGMFNHTPLLQTLDICSNDLIDLSSDLFYPLRSLQSLYMSRTGLRSLEFLVDANLTKLEFIQARRNTFSIISEDVIESLPALNYVDLFGNSFFCDCDNAYFIQWVLKNNQTQVFDAYSFECNYPPELKGMKLLDFDVQSCSVNTDFICFVSTTCTTLLLMVMSFTYHFLRWQLTYAYYFFLALLFDRKNRNRQTANQYDAFVSYNGHDEPWVIRELLPKLEGEQGWRLCLHHRDFEPGKPIIENITAAIYGSRKTICVISHRYLESEWCSREIQVASFRLFDEQKDVLILVFLDDIPTRQLSPFYRMRKLLKRRTYLSWPRAQEHPEVFWEKLRQALGAKDELGEETFLRQ